LRRAEAALSTIAANPGSRREPLDPAVYLATRRVTVGVAASALLAAAGGGVLVATSDHLVDPLAYAVQISVLVAATAAVALYWAVARPGNRIALLLLAYAAAIAVMSLQGAANPLLHSVGVLFDAPIFFLGYCLVFVFPLGRFVGAIEKVLLAGVAWGLIVSFLPWFFFSSVVSGGAPLAGCNANCPSNALMIADKPAIADGFGTAEEYIAVFVAVGIVAGLCYRLARASGPRSRALLPVYVPALLLTVPFAVVHAAGAGLIHLDAKSFDTLGWFVTAGRTTLSFGFLVAIWQAMLFAGVALKEIVGQLDREEEAVHLRGVVAEALDDPPLELAFEVDHGAGIVVDSRGEPIDVTSVGAGRSVTALRRRGETVGYIVHDAALDSDPELVQVAGQSVLLALESGRLEGELRSKTAELRTSRGRIAAAGETERRKIERDLHDGAQQRLMAIQIRLALLGERIDDSEIAAELGEIAEDATAAVDDLRRLAHGIYPPVLRERGLGDGLRSFAMTAPVEVEVVDTGIGRCAPAVEATLYFCSLEAIQNVMKHAGPRTRVTVTLERRGNDVQFAVVDDGAGFDPRERSEGIGLVSMRDRLGAFGGELEIVSSPGAGTRIRGTVPDAGSTGRSRGGVVT
jgi:signal transduction histidine kinase